MCSYLINSALDGTKETIITHNNSYNSQLAHFVKIHTRTISFYAIHPVLIPIWRCSLGQGPNEIWLQTVKFQTYVPISQIILIFGLYPQDHSYATLIACPETVFSIEIAWPQILFHNLFQMALNCASGNV